MDGILIIAYWVLGYIALNKVWYSKRTYLVLDGKNFFLKKAILALLFGWILIPVALIQMIFLKK